MLQMDIVIKENVFVWLDTTMHLIAPWTAVSFYWNTLKLLPFSVLMFICCDLFEKRWFPNYKHGLIRNNKFGNKIPFIPFTVSKVLIVTGKDTHDHIKVSEVIDLSIEGDHQCFDWFDYPLNISEATGGLVISNDINIYTNRYNLTDIDIIKNSYYSWCLESEEV